MGIRHVPRFSSGAGRPAQHIGSLPARLHVCPLARLPCRPPVHPPTRQTQNAICPFCTSARGEFDTRVAVQAKHRGLQSGLYLLAPLLARICTEHAIEGGRELEQLVPGNARDDMEVDVHHNLVVGGRRETGVVVNGSRWKGTDRRKPHPKHRCRPQPGRGTGR